MPSGFGGTGRSYSRRGSSRKQVKRQRQDYHKHKVRLEENGGSEDFRTLKTKTLQSLEILCHQVFYPESGYRIDNWLKSLNILLDDFESKASIKATLPQAYLSRKKEVLTKLSKPPEFQEIDSLIARAKSEEKLLIESSGIHNKAHFASKLISLKKRREQTAIELERGQEKLANKKSEPTRSLIRRIFNSKETASSELDIDICLIEKQLADLDSEIAATEKEEALYVERVDKQVCVRKKISELEEKKLERLRFIPEREEATKILIEEINKI